MLAVENLSVKYGELTVLDSVNCGVEQGQWLMVIGPNGAGKSTLTAAISQSVDYYGKVTLDGEDVSTWKRAKLARHLGVLMQSNNPGYSFSVEEVVALGRYAHSKGLLDAAGEGDADMVSYALEQTGMLEMRNKSVLALSGGELQRVFLAQVIAQDPRIMILDEPANHLDLQYQQHVFALVDEWLKQPGRAAISVVHDLSLARAFGTHALLLDRGKACHCGRIDQVMTEDNLSEVYSLDVYGWMRRMLGQWE